jgi:hypothetical protein
LFLGDADHLSDRLYAVFTALLRGSNAALLSSADGFLFISPLLPTETARLQVKTVSVQLGIRKVNTSGESVRCETASLQYETGLMGFKAGTMGFFLEIVQFVNEIWCHWDEKARCKRVIARWNIIKTYVDWAIAAVLIAENQIFQTQRHHSITSASILPHSTTIESVD